MSRLLLLALLCACTGPNDARDYLQTQGFREISTGGFVPGRCPSHFNSASFVATTEEGIRVSGVVCFGAEPFYIED